MINVKRIAYRLALLVFAIWGTSKAFGLYQIHYPNRNHPMIPELQNMQTYCVGNYLIDLPHGSEPLRLETDLAGARSVKLLSWPNTSREEFISRVNKRWSEIKDLATDGAITFEQPSQRFDAMTDGVVMTSQHHTMNLKEWPGGGKGPKSFYETDAFLWREGVLYVFSSSIGKDGVINAMKALQIRKEGEVPVGKGFCGGLSFFPGQPEANDYVWFAYRLPVMPHTEFRIQVPTGRSPHPDLALFESDKFRFRKLRDASRIIAGVPGKEWIEYDWQNEFEGMYETTLAAAWFGEGADEFGYPGIQLRLDTSSKAENIPPPKVGEMIAVEGQRTMSAEDFTALWDGITATLRLRPGAID